MTDKHYLSFRPGSPEVEALTQWFATLNDDRGGRAALRRCHRPAEAAFVPIYQDLYRKIKPLGRFRASSLEAIAALASRLKDDQRTGTLPAQMASSPSGTDSGPVLSELRFRRLLQKEDIETLYPDLRRALSVLDNRFNLQDLAQSLCWWNETQRRRWAYDYYGKAAIKA